MEAASARMRESVRPAIGTPRNASGIANSSSNASVIARTPAPPVSTSVPSMSKRISDDAVCSERLAFGADVSGPRPLRGRLFVKVDALAFVQLVEAALHGTAMKEPLLPAVVANEPEAPVADESFDSAGRHPSLLGRAAPKETESKYHSTSTSRIRPELQPSVQAHPVAEYENAYGRVYFTFTVIT